MSDNPTPQKDAFRSNAPTGGAMDYQAIAKNIYDDTHDPFLLGHVINILKRFLTHPKATEWLGKAGYARLASETMVKTWQQDLEKISVLMDENAYLKAKLEEVEKNTLSYYTTWHDVKKELPPRGELVTVWIDGEDCANVHHGFTGYCKHITYLFWH